MVYMKEIVTLILFNAWICVHGFIPIDSSEHSKLLKIRHLSNSSSSFVGGLKPTQEDPEVCYTQGCLDAAIEILEVVDFTADPCEDFQQFACGKWLADNPIPPEEVYLSRQSPTVAEVDKINIGFLKQPLDENDPLPVNQARTFFSECLNTGKIEEAGTAPMLDLLKEIGDWPILNSSSWSESEFDWIRSVATCNQIFTYPALIKVDVLRDLKNTFRYLIYLDQPTFGLHRSYLVNPETHKTLLEAYKTYIVEAAQELGSTEESIEVSAQAILEFEIKLANISLPDELHLDAEYIYNPYTLSSFQSESDAIDSSFKVDWTRFLKEAISPSGAVIDDNEEILVTGKSYLFQLIALLKSTPLKVVADYLGWMTVMKMAPESTEAMRNISFRFNQALTGVSKPFSRDVTCNNAVMGLAWEPDNFGWAISYKYIETEFDDETKDIVEQMTRNLKESFEGIINEDDWMEPVTKQKAIEKLRAVRGFIGYPEWIKNKTEIENFYSGLESPPGTAAYFKTKVGLLKWARNKKFKELRLPAPYEEWLMYPTVVNAFYLPSLNYISVPAGILRFPIFGKDQPGFQNYGNIGFVIGHEITHGFDDVGSKYDKDGNAINWWDELTRQRFQERGQCMVDQYDKFYIPSIDMHVNGQLTLGENIADNGGLVEGFRAYRKNVEQSGKEELRLPGLEQVTPNQLYFINYAGIWCDKMTDAYLTQWLLANHHAPGRYRIIGALQNSKEFAESFACPVDSFMNPPADTKCKVW